MGGVESEDDIGEEEGWAEEPEENEGEIGGGWMVHGFRFELVGSGWIDAWGSVCFTRFLRDSKLAVI